MRNDLLFPYYSAKYNRNYEIVFGNSIYYWETISLQNLTFGRHNLQILVIKDRVLDKNK